MIRSTLALLALVLAVPVAASAQSVQPTPPPMTAPAAPGAGPATAPIRHHHRNRFMLALHSLALTSAQQTQIDGFVRDTKAANRGADRDTKHANMKALRDEITGVLTPDQRAQLRAQLVQQRTKTPA